MKTLVLFISLLSSGYLFSGDKNSAYEAVCKNLTFESERQKCANLLKNFQYFDDTGLQICSSFTFQSDRLKCVLIIADKFYETYEIDQCKNAIFDSQKVQCLTSLGRPYNQTCLPRSEVLVQLKNAKAALDSGDTASVDKRLTYLINKFHLCRE